LVLQGLHFAAAQGLHGLHFAAAQGLHGLHFFAAQGLHGLHLAAAQGLQGLHPATICTDVSAAFTVALGSATAEVARVATLRATTVFLIMFVSQIQMPALPTVTHRTPCTIAQVPDCSELSLLSLASCGVKCDSRLVSAISINRENLPRTGPGRQPKRDSRRTIFLLPSPNSLGM
jgi:hypothetical protein